MANFFTGDRRLHLDEFIDWDRLHRLDERADKEIYAHILIESGRIIAEQIAPLARENDRSTYKITEDGALLWPAGIKECYHTLCDAGLACANISEQYGGLGLPRIVTIMLTEMLCQADAGFATISLLSGGVGDIIEVFGSAEQKQQYLPQLASGEFTGSMDLTEPDAGSDLGRIITKASDNGGHVFITGSKRFVSNGGANIHLVLARDADTFEVTKGTIKGISMYLVPHYTGKKQTLRVTRLEEKLGLHSSPTCEVQFEDAIGYLIGRKGEGVKQMFRLMNNARLSIAAQALGILESALQCAKAYAQERVQFGKPIVQHSLVVQMLVDMQAHSELIRAVIYETAFAVDMAQKSGNPVYGNKVAVLTPLIKFYAAEKAIELARKAVQVHGGVGYTKDFDVERHLRDSIITSIYEGTSEIQVSQFFKEALKGLQGDSRANAIPILEEIMGFPSETEESKEVSRCACAALESLKYMGGKMLEYMQDMDPLTAFNTLALQAKNLATMTVETYGAHLLLKQAARNERKARVARIFIADLVPHVAMCEAKIRSPHLYGEMHRIL